MRKLFVISLALAITLLSVGASSTDGSLIVNGDFEASVDFHDVPTGDWEWYETISLGGWTVANTDPPNADYNPGLEIWDTFEGHLAASGTQYVELDGYDPTTISQTPATDEGYCYELSYAWSPRPLVADNQMKVYVDNVEVASHVASGGDNILWAWETLYFQAASTSTTISFAEVGPDDQLGMLLDAVSLKRCPAIPVDIDIKPGSYPNSINLGSHGLVPVAILSSADFDATTVDPDTVMLAGAGVDIRGKSNQYMAHEEDVDGDGLLDLVCQVATANFDPGAFQDGYAVLTGRTFAGTPIEGQDEISIVPPE